MSVDEGHYNGSSAAAAAARHPSTEESYVDHEKRYFSLLRALDDLKSSEERDQAEYRATLAKLRAVQAGKRAVCEEGWSELCEFVRSVCGQSARSERSGERMTTGAANELLDAERRKYDDVKQARLENIRLRNKIAALERRLVEKDRIADSELSIVDFEQLRMENKEHKEKMEERKEEAERLQTRNATVVLIIAHFREKASAVSEQNRAQASRLAKLERNTARMRREITEVRVGRDQLRARNNHLRVDAGLREYPALARDCALGMRESEELRRRIDERRSEYSALVLEAERLRKSAKSIAAAVDQK